MAKPDYDKVDDDCNAALAVDKNYVKALNRRATALEKLQRYEEALRGSSGFVCSTFLSSFLIPI